MSDERRKRRSSFFPQPLEESHEKQLELFQNINWIDEEKENIIMNSVLFGDRGKKTLQEYTEQFKRNKQEYHKLVSNKQEEQIYLKEKLRKNNTKLDWKTVYEGLTDFEKDFANNRPDYKSLVENLRLLTLHSALFKRANTELHYALNAYNKRANEEIHKLQRFFIDKVVEDSGVGTSYNDSDQCNLSTKELPEDS